MLIKAKCKLCEHIIESDRESVFVKCPCEEIALQGGDSPNFYAKDFANFLAIEGDKETPLDQVSAIKHHEEEQEKINPKEALQEMIRYYDDLPASLSSSFVTHSDLHAVLLLLESFWRDES